MCLVVFAQDFHKDYRLILAANRDEFYERKSMKAAFWEDAPGVLAGRDMQAGGTWMGVHENGKFSAITNYRDPYNKKANAPTRGTLPLDYLKGDLGPLSYLKKLQGGKGKEYNGFNLLTANQHGMFHYNNVANKISRAEKGIHALSNASLNTPWPKVMHAKLKLRNAIENGFDTSSLLDLMYDVKKAPDNELPKTGVTLKWERELSPMFIKTPEYGTCSSAVVLISKDQHIVFAERVYNPTSGICKEQKIEFDIKPSE